MTSEPYIEERPAVPYAAIRQDVTMDGLAEVADRIPEVFMWLSDRGARPAGAPFLRYVVIDMAGRTVVEAGVPVVEPVEGEGEVLAETLPAGRYATYTHVGPPDELVGVTAAMLGWGAREGLEWDMTATSEEERWACRLEIYRTDPSSSPTWTNG